MKKLVTSILLGAMVFAAVNVQARNVSEQEARQAAAYYLNYNTELSVKAADLVLVHQIDNMQLGVAESYLYNVGNQGWIIMSGSTAIEPVVAYSEEGLLPENYSELPSNMRWWVDNYSDMIGEVQVADIDQKFDDMQDWTDLINQTLDENAPKGSSIILVRTSWDQGSNDYPTYNLYCPQVNGAYCYTGCVATAMAQIIRYWECPKQGVGRRSYNWRNNGQLSMRFDTVFFDYDLMPSRLTDAYGNVVSGVTQAEIEEVAKLSYACGISVSMDYDPEGSGALSQKVVSAMGAYFRYTYGEQIYRNGTNDTSFIGRMRRDMIRKYPVYMSGGSSTGTDAHAAGHAWIASGYKIDTVNTNNEKMYYMNWGWAGSGNGWYNLVNNNMAISGMGYNFNTGQAIIAGVHPLSPDSTSVDFLDIPAFEDCTELYKPYPNPANLTVSLPYSINSASEMVIYGIDGNVVATRRLQAGEGSVVMNVSDMPAGIYIYRVGGKSGKFVVGR